MEYKLWGLSELLDHVGAHGRSRIWFVLAALTLDFKRLGLCFFIQNLDCLDRIDPGMARACLQEPQKFEQVVR